MITPEQRQHALDLIQQDKKLDAVRYLQNQANLSAEESLSLAERLEKEIEEASEIESPESTDDEASDTSDVPRLFGKIFMGAGIAMLAFVLYLIYSNYQFSQRAVTVKGKVVSFITQRQYSKKHAGSTLMYSPVFEYQFKGTTYTHESSASSSDKIYEINQDIDILVDPDQPKHILVESFMEQWFTSVLVGGLGILFAGVGYLVFRFMGKEA